MCIEGKLEMEELDEELALELSKIEFNVRQHENKDGSRNRAARQAEDEGKRLIEERWQGSKGC